MYSYEITEDFKAIVYAPSGEIINNPGPWISAEEAQVWVSAYVNGLNDGSIPWPKVEND
jgi:hypothetical protein